MALIGNSNKPKDEIANILILEIRSSVMPDLWKWEQMDSNHQSMRITKFTVLRLFQLSNTPNLAESVGIEPCAHHTAPDFKSGCSPLNATFLFAEN